MSDKSTRDRIVEAADQLFYQQGFEHTSFTDIADAVQISRGNFYHHFKTKDEILGAVIALRLANTRKMLAHWEAQSEDPAARIRSFINILIMNRAKIKLYGCPVGTLCSELVKLEHVSQPEANKLFTLFRSWLRVQFSLLGYQADADELAMHVLAFSQGVATLASTFHDEKFIRQEVRKMEDWLVSLSGNTMMNTRKKRSTG